MHQGIAPAVDPVQIIVVGVDHGPGVFPQQHPLVEGMAMVGGDRQQIVDARGLLHLVVQAGIAGNRRDEGLKGGEGHAARARTSLW